MIESVAAMSAFYFQYWTHGFAGHWLDLPASGDLYHAAVAMTLAAIVMAQIGNLFALHTGREPLWRMRVAANRFIWIGALAALIIACAVIYLPALQPVFGTAAFPPINWLFLLLWSPILLVADQLRQGAPWPRCVAFFWMAAGRGTPATAGQGIEIMRGSRALRQPGWKAIVAGGVSVVCVSGA